MKTPSAPQKISILYVDDDLENLESFKALFRRDYNVLLADSAREALAILDRIRIQVLITDQRMPEMTGSDLLEAAADHHPDMIRFMLTGFSDFNPLVDAINRGRIQGFFSKSMDVTLIKMSIEKSLSAYYLKVKNEALDKALRQARKMEAIGALASGIAHDFNNILVPIVGYSELIASDAPPNSEHGEYARRILHAGYRARDLITRILTFSRGRELEKTPVLVQSLAKEALKLMRASLPATVVLDRRIDNNCAPILGDSTQIYQVDDDEAVVKVVQEILEDLGYQVAGFSDSREALAHFKRRPDDYDLVISDMTMPHATGLEFAEAIMSVAPDTAIVICTGYSEELTRIKAAKSGVRRVVSKPIIKSEFALILREILEGK
ncbi:MAG: response regulator [Proteobacteria bacterium]|nr:response regulator [Pseudomonadota bacterium]